MSKKSVIMALVAGMAVDMARKDKIAAITATTGVSAALASTYLSNINTNKWTDEPKAAKEPKVKVAKAKKSAKAGLTIDAINAMSSKELVEAFNKKADKPVTKFRDHTTAVKRTLDVYGLAGA